MKRYILTIIMVTILCLTGCGETTANSTYQQREQPHLYRKEIDVIVTDIETKHWFGGTHWYLANVTVESEEYGLTESFEFKGSGMFGCPKEYHYEEGQVIEAELFSWVIDSTGEVVEREIGYLY